MKMRRSTAAEARKLLQNATYADRAIAKILSSAEVGPEWFEVLRPYHANKETARRNDELEVSI